MNWVWMTVILSAEKQSNKKNGEVERTFEKIIVRIAVCCHFFEQGVERYMSKQRERECVVWNATTAQSGLLKELWSQSQSNFFPPTNIERAFFIPLLSRLCEENNVAVMLCVLFYIHSFFQEVVQFNGIWWTWQCWRFWIWGK